MKNSHKQSYNARLFRKSKNIYRVLRKKWIQNKNESMDDFYFESKWLAWTLTTNKTFCHFKLHQKYK